MIDVTVVGCGFMGRNHAHAVADHPQMDLVSVVDLDEAAAQEVAQKHGTTAATDFDRAVDDSEAVVVATPEQVHTEQANTVLDRDRHLLLEKPVTVDTDEAWKLADRAAGSDLATGVSFILRYDPGYAGIHKAVSNGEIGHPVSVRARRGITRSESMRIGERGHPLYYMNVHDIDAIRWVVGSDVQEVTAVEQRGELEEIDVPDAVHATLTFEDGTVGVLSGVGVLRDDTPGGITASLELVGTTGTAAVDTPGTTLTVNGTAGYDRPDLRHWPVVNNRMDGAVRRQIDFFERAINGDDDMIASIRDGAHAQAIADAIRTAIETGEPTAVDVRA
jgi:myo-inositol 2-dehydrogenase/D-chiro-inositol 1-dehydrogenase